jgi:hypothetical protein
MQTLLVLLRWRQVSKVDLHQERSIRNSSSANIDVAQSDSEQIYCSLCVPALFFKLFVRTLTHPEIGSVRIQLFFPNNRNRVR